jgi:hypothetical protein
MPPLARFRSLQVALAGSPPEPGGQVSAGGALAIGPLGADAEPMVKWEGD